MLASAVPALDDAGPNVGVESGKRSTRIHGMAIPPSILGAGCLGPDGDCDGDIDLVDFLLITVCFNGPATPSGDDCTAFDLDRDGDTDLADLLAFQARFTGAR